MKKIILGLSVLFLMVGCIPSPHLFSSPKINENNTTEVMLKTQKKEDKFTKYTHYIAPTIKREIGKNSIMAYIDTAFKEKYSGRSNISILIYYYGRKWKFFDTAYDIDGNQMKVISAGREVRGCSAKDCSFSESMMIPLSNKYLEKHLEKGIKIKIMGRGDDIILNFTPQYLQGFYEAIKEK
jgi:hypothetical protein